MKRYVAIALLLALSLCAAAGTLPKLPRGNVNFIVLSDSGDARDSLRQRAARLADNLDLIAAGNKIDFILHAGDEIHDNGVVSIDDPEWKFKLVDLYARPHLTRLPWYGVAGNHEYRADAQAVADYSAKQSWWKTPSLYYSFEKKIDSRNRLLVAMMDTSPMIASIRKNSKGKITDDYVARELHWADSVLSCSDATWKIVVGHHPVYADSPKSKNELMDMRSGLLPIMEKSGVDLYINGHLHDFQHIKRCDSGIHFVTNSSPVRKREPKKTEGSLFRSGKNGFTVCSVSPRDIHFYFVDYKGRLLYDFAINKAPVPEKLFDQGDIQTISNTNVQGVAVCGDEMFSLRDKGACVVTSLASGKLVSEFNLASGGANNHANVAFFSREYYRKGDRYPLLYVSQCKDVPVEELARPELEGMSRLLFVERILTDEAGKPVGAELVQVISYEPEAWNSRLWIADPRRSGVIWCYGNTVGNEKKGNRILLKKFRFPSKDKFLVCLKDSDALETLYFDDFLPAKSRGPQNTILQGASIIDDILFLPTGTGVREHPSEIFWLNLRNRKSGYVELTSQVPCEMEDFDLWIRGKQKCVVCVTNSRDKKNPVYVFNLDDFRKVVK